MAEQQNSIDLRTLEEVHRLLASTDFASIDDIARRSDDPARLTVGLDRVSAGAATSGSSPDVFDSTDLALLPRRR